MDLDHGATNLDLLCIEVSEALQTRKLVAEFEKQLPKIRERVADYKKQTKKYHDARTPLVTELKEGDDIMIQTGCLEKLVPRAERLYVFAKH